ncbi:MAG: ATP-dependent DNA helicase RecG, partial [Gammaproteobacteria bacterium]|nr:ATP-dependent DNA helicase RecG [Gammaproteobacteria bacterium]
VALAALQALEAGYQVAMMVPTELLAEQHLGTFRQWLGPLGIEPLWLVSKVRRTERSAMISRLKAADLTIAIGTHALFQPDVRFAKLGLVIIDEQHRFGVHQRLALREKGSYDGYYPHQLILTATPIPRTLAMTAYADLDNSIIDEMPPNRQPIKSVVLPDSRREEVIQRIANACRQGRQVYWVCTLIEESEVLQCQAATETAKRLARALPRVRMGLIHGRMQDDEREHVMAEFKMGNIDVLVATTVIEVGVDVPNASLMVIENAERLGLAQLHQLRGRIGRGTLQSDCVLMYQAPLTEHARARLSAIRQTTNGFDIARRDLELRGPGELLGTRQAGVLNLRIADLVRDRKLLPDIQETADLLLQDYPDHVDPLIQRWVGRSLNYGNV